MTMTVVFRPAARREFDEAALWYEQHLLGLGAQFVLEIDRAVHLAAENPQRFPIMYRDVRCVRARRFPYSVFFRSESLRVVVLSVFHAQRFRAEEHRVWKAEILCSRIAMLKQGEVVALDKTRNLLASFSEKYLRLTLVSGQLPAEVQAQVVASDGVQHTIALQDYGEVEPVLVALREAGASIKEMEVVQPDLEEAFVKIMNRQ